ncbi:MAG TPA: phosphate acyltransferase PlsX [Methylomirabilota bacterium]|nr:phosphate acyltransferase PlsX [Methylomirabilota bacterium]
MYIAVDAMGGDHAPQAVVEGAFLAAQEHGIAVLLVGDRGRLLPELTRVGGAESSLVAIRHAAETIEMGESPVSALRRKPNSSLQVAFQAVKTGEAGAVVSAGNTGAVLALAVTVLGNLSGVDRPAIITAIPAVHGYTYLLDAGANIECKPLHLVQFAVMGEIYARVVRAIAAPRVGVLSNGEEDSKGTDVTRAAHEILKKLPLHYIGYVEGRDLNNGKVDVVVTDGFTGNVALKTMEGFAGFLTGRLRAVFTANWRNKLAYLLVRSAFDDLRATLDPSEVGGAPLLGAEGLAIIAHGASSPKAIKNAIRVADQSVRSNINRQIVESIHALPEATLAPAELKRGRKFWAQIRERFRHARDTHETPPPATEPTAEEEKPS